MQGNLYNTTEINIYFNTVTPTTAVIINRKRIVVQISQVFFFTCNSNNLDI